MRFKKVDQTGAGKGKKHCSRISLELISRKIGYQAKQQARAGSR